MDGITNELRLGNYVSSMNRPRIIDAIHSNGEVEFDETDHRFNFTDIEPIPLTEEILMRCEWQLVKGIDFYINSYFCIDNRGRLYYHGDYTGINIRYLHQLQNLYFALTGKELEVSL